jgi:hypothetical protein
MNGLNFKTCARCAQIKKYPGDWFGDLCPECADETEGVWICRACGRRGDFEAMGGSGAENPWCCGAFCQQTHYD